MAALIPITEALIPLALSSIGSIAPILAGTELIKGVYRIAKDIHRSILEGDAVGALHHATKLVHHVHAKSEKQGIRKAQKMRRKY